jgi:hypothetical protein
MYFQESDREKFAELIIGAVGLLGTDYADDFIKSTKDFQGGISGSIVWRDKVIEWIKEKKENRDKIKNQIKANPHDVRAVFKLVDDNLRHY